MRMAGERKRPSVVVRFSRQGGGGGGGGVRRKMVCVYSIAINLNFQRHPI